MNQILLRHAEDDFAALLTASAMTKAGAEVFSITNNGPARPVGFGSITPHEDHLRPQKFIVWARVRDEARQVRDCAMLGESCQTIKPLTRSERAIVKRTVRAHAKLMTAWAEKLP